MEHKDLINTVQKFRAEDEFDLMADRILTSTEWQYRPQDVTREKFIACMKEQNKIGQEFKKQTASL